MIANLSLQQAAARRTLFVVGLMFAVLTSSVAIAQAQVSDVTPPTLTGLSFTPNSVDVTGGPQTVTVTATVTDNLAGVSSILVQFTSLAVPIQREPLNSLSLARISGTSLNGTYRGTLQIPQYSQGGVWKLSVTSLSDAAGNIVSVSAANLATAGFATDLTVTSIPDVQPPTVLGINFSPSIIDVSTSNQTLTMTLTLSDDVSGVDFTPARFLEFRTTFVSPSLQQHQYVGRLDFTQVSGTLLTGEWRAAHSFPAHSEPGTWSIQSLQIIDFARNQRFFSTANLIALGLNPQFTVVSSSPDTTAPQVTGLTFTPSVIDTSLGSQTVQVTLNATDDLSGVDFSPDNQSASFPHGLIFRSPSGGQTRQVNNTQFTRIAGTPNDGTWRGTVVFPRFSEAGTWTATVTSIKDVAQNTVSLTPAQLASAGFPSQLVIFQPSETPDGTVGPAGGTVSDSVFGNAAAVTFPSGALASNTSVAIDVLNSPLNVPTPAGFGAGTLFINVALTPTPAMPFAAPGLTLTLPISTSVTLPSGSLISLYRLDPVTGLLVPAVDVNGLNVVGTVNASGQSATFTGVSHLSTLVGFVATAVVGDVNGDRLVSCTDMAIVKAAFGKRLGQFGFDPRADVNRNGVVDISDLGVVSRQLPAGTTCQ